MFFRATLGLLFFFCANAFGYQFPLEIIEHFDDVKVVISVKESDIRNTPGWRPADGPPPLTIEEVVKKVYAWCAQDAKLKNASILKIELKPILRHEKQNRWYYLVQLKTPANALHAKQYLAILMDGKILPAIREPASYK